MRKSHLPAEICKSVLTAIYLSRLPYKQVLSLTLTKSNHLRQQNIDYIEYVRYIEYIEYNEHIVIRSCSACNFSRAKILYSCSVQTERGGQSCQNCCGTVSWMMQRKRKSWEHLGHLCQMHKRVFSVRRHLVAAGIADKLFFWVNY